MLFDGEKVPNVMIILYAAMILLKNSDTAG